MISPAILLLALLTTELELVITHQPIVSFKAVYGSKLAGVGLYQIRACAAETPVSLSGSRILTFAAAHVAPIDTQLIPAVRNQARRKSILWRTARTMTWAGMLGGLLTAGGASALVAATPGIAIAMPIIALISDRLGAEVAGREQQALAIRLLVEEDRWQIPPLECKAGLFWGRWAKGMPETFSGMIKIP